MLEPPAPHLHLHWEARQFQCCVLQQAGAGGLWAGTPGSPPATAGQKGAEAVHAGRGRAADRLTAGAGLESCVCEPAGSSVDAPSTLLISGTAAADGLHHVNQGLGSSQVRVPSFTPLSTPPHHACLRLWLRLLRLDISLADRRFRQHACPQSCCRVTPSSPLLH